MIAELICFPFLFAPAFVLGYTNDNVGRTYALSDQVAMTVYYSCIAVFDGAAWAFVQISHLAMIPEIASKENDRGSLTAIRNIGSVVSNITVYCITWIMLGIGDIEVIKNWYYRKLG